MGDLEEYLEILLVIVITTFVLCPELYPGFLPDIPHVVYSVALATRGYQHKISPLIIFYQIATVLLYIINMACPISADQMRRLLLGPSDLAPKHLQDEPQATRTHIEHDREPMHDWRIRLTNALHQMMFVSGETAEASAETTAMIEEIVHTQVIEMVGAFPLSNPQEF